MIEDERHDEAGNDEQLNAEHVVLLLVRAAELDEHQIHRAVRGGQEDELKEKFL